MYGWLWRHLPGPWPVRALLLAVAAGVVVGACFLWLFPWVSSLMPFNDVTVDQSAPAVVAWLTGV
jgi:hypothetical protein